MLATEIGFGQADAVVGIATAAGLRDVRVQPDLAGIPRIVIGVAP